MRLDLTQSPIFQKQFKQNNPEGLTPTVQAFQRTIKNETPPPVPPRDDQVLNKTKVKVMKATGVLAKIHNFFKKILNFLSYRKANLHYYYIRITMGAPKLPKR